VSDCPGTDAQPPPGPLAGLRILELADEKGQFCGKLLGDLGADVVKIEPPGGERNRHVGPFLDDIPHPERSLSFWYYNTSKRGITLNLETGTGRQLFGRLAAASDVILEIFRPGFLACLGLDYECLHKQNPRMIMCALTPFGQTGPWRDYLSSDLLHMAAVGEMASSGYDEADVPNAPPIAPGGGNAWHMGCHFAYMAIMAALVYRTVAGQGQYIDASIHEACALTTESAIANYIYRGEVLRRQTGRHHAPGPTPRTQFRARDGTYVTALVAGRLNPKYVRDLADLLDSYGMAGDLKEPKYQDPAVIAARTHLT
jgi:crotonobetainyl-CoA:carnitine CoA-transferase CaiB-like acyl-CoA transferase